MKKEKSNKFRECFNLIYNFHIMIVSGRNYMSAVCKRVKTESK